MSEPKPFALLSFQHHVGDLYLDPAELEFVSELGEGEFDRRCAGPSVPRHARARRNPLRPPAGEYAIVEKGRLRGATDGPYGAGIPITVKSFKPGMVASPEDLRELVIEAHKLGKLRHK